MAAIEQLECERCDRPGAEQVGRAFLCAACVEALGLCAHCKREDATVDFDDARVCDGCFDDAMASYWDITELF